MRRTALPGLSAERYYAEARESALRSAARLAAAREANQRHRRAVLAQRELDRDRRQRHDADRLWSMNVGIDRLGPPRP